MSMEKRFINIRVLIWDFDGTLYRMIPALKEEIRESEYRVIENHTGWSRGKTIAEFLPLYKKTHSGTTTAARLSGITTTQAALEGERFINRGKHLQPDKRLVKMFQKLHRFTHYMLVNGVQLKTKIFLRHLGLDPAIFKEIVTSEVVGENKPSLKGFQYILDKTKVPPECHLMIGDREEVDLIPANKLGIATCLVWSKKTSQIADITAPTVYNITSILH